MVTTRGSQQSSGHPGPTVVEAATTAPSDRSVETGHDAKLTAPHEAEVGTIGSRLRKRRRTGSSPVEGTPSKRPNTRQTTSPDSKRNTHTQIETQARESTLPPTHPTMNGTAEPLPEVVEREIHKPAIEPAEPAPLPAASSSAPDLAAVIANIIDHGEHVDNHWAAQGYEYDGTAVDSDDWLSVGASLNLKIQSLPILDNLSTQILNTLAKTSHQDIINIITEPETDAGQAYATLKSLFDHTKKVYSIHGAFLSAYDLTLTDQGHIDTIRKANLATFVSSVFGSHDVGFYDLNEHFLDTFVADGNRLLKSQAQLLLDLKTQAYISAMANGERSRDEILEDLFPDNLEQLLLHRRPGAKQLAPSEADFVIRARSRRDRLLADSNDEEAIAALPEKYLWEVFLRDVSGYVSKNFDTIVGTPARKPLRSRPSALTAENFQQQEVQAVDPEPYVQSTDDQDANSDIVEKAARAAQYALQGLDSTLEQPPAQNQPQHYEQSFQDQRGPVADYHYNGQPQQPSDQQAEIPYHTQTAPTQVLYERARLAATAKASPSNRRAGLPSQRRPWTTEEENALMAGLDRVKGPHWSQILAMFGPGGTINESLKDRNQVQLKDKARNLKLFFLKSGIEVPYYLQFVTGELKTRAPAQAAKNEARERAKQRGDEDRAHIEGVMALAGGQLQNLPQAEPNGEENTGVAEGDSQPQGEPMEVDTPSKEAEVVQQNGQAA